jgi:CheY-like chemotaxis protein
MHILIVEDDKIQLELLIRGLNEVFSTPRITSFRTEKEFRGALETIAMNPPDVIILDIMLKWTEPSRDQEPAPPDVIAGKFYRAGFRCQELLQRGDKTRNVPVILYTVVGLDEYLSERATLPSNVRILQKEAKLDNLLSVIHELTGYPGSALSVGSART